ncbi:SDR family oxidoreductase [Gephyromycinifex aptenodytis]|uniref:SDR family oxidoreductase n=1 Tax=Gephyromycinifex aptenodytis TaxID=2716227 RepID=UPI0021F8DFD5|nr:NAD(P)-dependent oxidoreductase [Gephyromycinifex aptenodytis]
MPAEAALSGRTLVMSGGSRGIGLSIALAAARLGANIALVAKTDTPDPRLPGTVHTAAEEIRAAGGQVLPLVGDIRNEEDVDRLVDAAVAEFGGIDIVVNNASAINLSGTQDLPVKRLDLMLDINLRGTFLLTRAALAHLRRSSHPHVLTLAPPINLDPAWLGAHPAYTMSKYAMSLVGLSIAAENADAGVASNCLWPETAIATAAVRNMAALGGVEMIEHSRDPQIMADAAMIIVSADPAQVSGHTLIDADVLRTAGRTDLSGYGGTPPLALDLFL